ncbi:MAG: hypothetical protein ACO1O6_00455 [Bacteroidota bacterium]
MKKMMIIWGLLTTLLFAPQMNAQVNVNININSQPAWGPVGYDYVEYYYLPDIDMYYSVIYNKYIYWDNGQWVWVTVLPARYNYYNFYTGYKVVINRPNPYYRHDYYKVKYKKYRNYSGHQNVIRDVKGGRPSTGGWDSNLKKQAPEQRSVPQKKNSTLKKQAPAKNNAPQKGSPLKKQAPTQSTPQKGSPLKKQAPAQQRNSPQKSSPIKKQAPTQPNSPQKTSPIKKQAPVQHPSSPQKSSPIKKQAPTQQKSSPQKSSPLKNQAPAQQRPISPQKSSPIKKQAPTQPSKSSPLKKAKGG